MPESPLPEFTDDQPLEANLARLLNRDGDRPALSAAAESHILESLRAKQAELVARKEPSMDRSVTAAAPQRANWAFAAVALVVVACLFMVTLFFPAIAPNGGGGSPSESGGDGDDSGEVAENTVKKDVDATQLTRTKLADGTVVIARPGAKYTLDAPRQITLHGGDLYLIVAKSKTPFVVNTNNGTVTATGTRFVVSAGDETTAAVAQGHVTLAGKQGQTELQVGEQGVLRDDGPPQRTPAPRLSHLVSWAKEALAQEDLLVEKTAAENGLIAVDPWGQESRLTLRQYNVDVYIEDGIARTTIDQTFFNHYPWNTEGTFYFPLPPDASVSRLAMYVNGQLNEGGMVERGRGQEIYTEILYQRRDPALLEMMEGNVFKMRIFPLEGRQEKRILLSYTQNLEELYGAQRYWFPMDHTNSLANKLSISVRVKGAAESLTPQSSTHELKSSTDGDDLLLSYETKSAKPDQDFLLSLVPSEAPEATRLATTEQDGFKFVFGRFTPKIAGEVTAKPRQWIVLNDISASRLPIESKAQQYILRRWLEEADDHDQVFVIDVNTRAEAVSERFVDVRSDDAKKLLARRVDAHLGATNLAAGIEAAAKIIEQHKAANPHILYLGDGVATDGTTEVFTLVRAIPRSATFVGIGVGKKVDSLFLQTAADQSGGMYTTINPDEDIDWRVFDMIAALNTPRITKLVVSLQDAAGKTLNRGDAIAYPSSRSLAQGETLTVVARCPDKLPAKIVLDGMISQKKFHSETALDDAEPDAAYLPRLWAKRHIDELTKSDMERKDEIIELSKHYYVVTPLTSLIVLEDDAMYEQYKVERGRKDHWALYPAPKTIEVVKEPVDWNRWGWYGYGPGEDAKIEATSQPKSVRDIVDSVQFRIDAPFYYWPHQQSGQGRYALYELLDNEVDPTRLLTYWYLVAAGADDAATNLRNVASNTSSTAETPPPAGKPMQRPILAVMEDEFLGPRQMMARESEFGGRAASVRYSLENFDMYRSGNMLASSGRLMLPLKLMEEDRKKLALPQLLAKQQSAQSPLFAGFERKRALPSMALAGQSNDLRGTISDGRLPPELLHSFEKELGQRWSRINQDIRDFNRQHGYWDEGYGGTWNSLDLRQTAGARWYGGLEGLFGDLEAEEMAERPQLAQLRALKDRLPMSQMLFSGRRVAQNEKLDRAAVAAVGIFNETVTTQPGTCSVLAADYLAKRRNELLEKALTPEGKSELDAINEALAGLRESSARLENSGPFWDWQGWNYRPQVWTFQPPTVQVYHNYNWSFDLTSYAPALYSSSFDVLNEVAGQFGTKNEGRVSERAQRRIDAARAAIQSVAIRYEGDETELLVAAGDRFAMSRVTEMYLAERMVCDGQQIVHFYDELGLAARRPATELRLAALRQLAPHLIEPAESLAARFNVELASAKDDEFTLDLTPLHQSDDAKQKFVLTVRVAHDGRLLEKAVSLGGELQLTMVYQYDAGKVTAKWLDKHQKELAVTSFHAEPRELNGEHFQIDATEFVVFEMPLRKPSYYAEQLQSIDAKDHPARIAALRHQALASIQEFHWRRWGGTNAEAQQMLTDAANLMRGSELAARLGDVTLLGSAGVQGAWSTLNGLRGDGAPPLKLDVAETHPVAQYYLHRYSGVAEAAKIRDAHPGSLIGHLAAYQATAIQNNLTEHFDSFTKNYPDSPLLLAATYYASNWGNRPAAWLKLLDHPDWRQLAIMMSAGVLKEPAHQKQLAEAFAKLYDEAAEAGYDVPITAQVAAIVKQHAPDVWQRVVDDKLARAKKSEDTAPLLHLAEEAMSWGETPLADQTLALARERLAEQDSLLGRFALAQVYWAGGRFAEAWKLHDEVLKRLAESDVAASPALLASAARLAQQTGDLGRAIELEEQSLAAEHPYLPELINLQAFRQRYSWLWQQYQAKINEAVANKDDKAAADWLSRAEAAWQRWYEVDQENGHMPAQMATLQMTAGQRDDAWLYLSTVIDKHPRDAQSYHTVGQWYRDRGELAETEQWFARAYQWDTANPRWLLERGQVLTQLGRQQEARQVYQQIVDGQWAPGLQGYVDQARSALNQ